jgi:hypothetical protein
VIESAAIDSILASGEPVKQAPETGGWAASINLPPELAALPPVVDLATAARLGAGVTRNTAYRLAREGSLPFPVIKVGRDWKVSRHELLRSLGYAVDPVPAKAVAG